MSEKSTVYYDVAEQDAQEIIKAMGREPDEKNLSDGMANLVFYDIDDAMELVQLLAGNTEVDFVGSLQHLDGYSDVFTRNGNEDPSKVVFFQTLDGDLAITLDLKAPEKWVHQFEWQADIARNFAKKHAATLAAIKERARKNIFAARLAKEIGELLDWVGASINTIPTTTREELKGRVESLRKLLSDAPAIEPGTKHKVLIHVEAGIVQATFSTDPKNIEVFVRDFDNVEPGEEPIEYMSISDPIDDPRATEGK